MSQERGKAPLMLMEQVVMVLVFALAAALCVQAFVTASLMSKKSVAEDHGANISQSMAEVIKETHGDLRQASELLDGNFDGESLLLYFDKEWEPVSEEDAVYVARAFVSQSGAYCSTGMIEVEDIQENEEIFSLNIGWQEVESDE